MIIGLGCLAHDHILATETTWESGKGRVVHTETRFGGNVRNALATVASLDHPAAYLGSVGLSASSDEAMADLTAHGISTDFIERVEGADPVMSRITVTAGGERYVAFDDSTLATTPLPGEALVDAALSVADAVLVDACVAPPGTLQVIERARDLDVPVVLDAERDPSPSVLALVDAADHLVIPLGFGATLTGASTPVDIAAGLWNERRSSVVLTDGIRGCYAWELHDRQVHVSAFEVTAVDTTGCGDAFHGAYAWSLVNGGALKERVRLASAAAAVLAALPAGAKRTPSREAIESLVVD